MRRFVWVLILSGPAVLLPAKPATAVGQLPANLATQAKVSASSEHNQLYLARFAVDGKIPPANSSSLDRGAAWAVLRSKSGDQATFRLQWDKPVEVATIVYWGRTAWGINECWKDYEIHLDDAPKAAVTGTFARMHGPQRIDLPSRTRVREIVMKFLNSYGGANPGAAEIQVFATRPTNEQLAEIDRRQTLKAPAPEAVTPQLPAADPAALAELISELQRIHGPHYRQAAEHRTQLERLIREKPAASPPGKQAAVDGSARPSSDSLAVAWQQRLEQLQRRVLLFDVDRVAVIRRHEILASHVYTYHYEGFRAGGALEVVDLSGDKPQARRLVESPTGQILDLDVSYDGGAILFSWRQTRDEGYHLWQIAGEGSGLKQLSKGAWHDYNGCWLPDGAIAFLSTRWPQFAYCWHAPVGVLCRMNPDGSKFQRLSANYLNDFTPTVLESGRIIYTRWEYVDRPAIPIQSLWTINPDGTGLAGYFGNRKISPGTFMEARAIPGTSRILCTMTGHNGPTRGAIGIINRYRGDNAQAAIENVTPDVPIPKIDEGNGNTSGSKLYSGPYPLDRVRFLVSARGPLLIRTLDGKCQSIALEAPADGMQYLAAQPLRPRPRPAVVPSALPSKPEPMATVFLQDVYQGLEPYVARGEVKAIRVVRELSKGVRIDPKYRAFDFQFPVISCGATYAAKEVLGEVAVEPDGSACFQVPPGVPLYFMALDAQGRAVQRMRTFTHLMPGETQGCIGCHESRSHASGRQMPVSLRQPAKSLTPPEWGFGGFDYVRVVQPVFDRHCSECHHSFDPPKGIDLSGGKTDFFNVSYEILARENWGRLGSPYVKWIPTNNGHEWNILEITPKFWGSPSSKLADVIVSGHRDSRGKRRFVMDEKSRRRILAWIDLNVPYYGTSETAYPENPGCRQILPAGLEQMLHDVGRRRCAECHADGRFPRRVWTRIIEPDLNPFLLAPLARADGGTEKCGRPIFHDKGDPDYQAILKLFEPIEEMLEKRPRMDMPGAKPAEGVCRACQ